MLSDRSIIETDKADLRLIYPDTTEGLAALKALALTFFNADPRDTLVTGSAFEGGSANSTRTDKRELRRQAIQELIQERDPDYAPAPTRANGSAIQLSI